LTPPIEFDNLFKLGKLLGVHMLKFTYTTQSSQTEKRVWFVFTFAIDDEIYTQQPNLGWSSHSGKKITHVNIDLFFNILEMGEMIRKSSVTYQEFSMLLYLKLNPYIINGDTQNIFFTKLDNKNPILQSVCQKLNMQEIMIVKEKVDKDNKERFKILVKPTTQSGGAIEYITNESNIKLKISKNIKIFEPMCGIFYEQFMTSFLENIKNKKYFNYYNKSSYIYPYFFSNEIIIPEHFKYTEKHKLIKYTPITIQFYRAAEIFKLYLQNYI
jgi:hypothetical protein